MHNSHNIYIPKPADILKISELTEHEKLFSMRLSDGKRLDHLPGQFVEVSISGIGEAPISISSAPSEDNTFELCVRNAGDLTASLHTLKEGDKVGIRGPFGRGFPLDELKGNNIVFIAGGIGMVPLRSLISYAISRRDDYKNITILYGAKSDQELFFREEIAAWGTNNVKIILTIDKPSPRWNGKVGVVTTLFPEVDFDSSNTYAVVVGPPIMYKFVILGLGNRKISANRIILSLERRMKCGLGKCGHCQIGSFYVCKDGPVFSYSEIKHMKGVV